MPTVLDGQPALYRELLPSLAVEIPPETKATCDACAMARESTPKPQRFRADTKCCTYHPKLPNYLVGGLLADPDPQWDEGRQRVREKIRRRVGVTPQWLRAPPKYDLLYQQSRDSFGRSAALRCPYYVEDSGRCSVWAYREAVCSTFHCRYVAAADGRALWMQLKRALSLVELALSRWALLQHFPAAVLKAPDASTAPVDAAALDDLDGDEFAHLVDWGDWHEREEELYVACWSSVRSLSAADLPRLLGVDGDIAWAVVEQLRQAVISPVLPARPRLNPHLTVVHQPDGTVGVGFHSEFDALALPAEAWRLLAEFRGDESLAAVRKRLREEFQADLHDALYVELHRHRVLI